MDKYWYISTNHHYPRPSDNVNQVTLLRGHSLIEMSHEATEEDFETCKLIYVGIGQFNAEHIQENYRRYERVINGD